MKKVWKNWEERFFSPKRLNHKVNGFAVHEKKSCEFSLLSWNIFLLISLKLIPTIPLYSLGHGSVLGNENPQYGRWHPAVEAYSPLWCHALQIITRIEREGSDGRNKHGKLPKHKKTVIHLFTKCMWLHVKANRHASMAWSGTNGIKSAISPLCQISQKRREMLLVCFFSLCTLTVSVEAWLACKSWHVQNVLPYLAVT